MEGINHKFGSVKAIKENVEDTREVDFVISTNARDRDGEVVEVDKWHLDNFNKNGIVGYQHAVWGGFFSDPNPDLVLGTGSAKIEDNVLVGTVKFEPEEVNPLAEKIFRKVLHGTLKATSVGFRETVKGSYGKGEEAPGGTNTTYYYGGQELMEFSIVNIPANPEALRKSFGSQSDHWVYSIKQVLGEKYSFADIEKMTVGEVIDLSKGKKSLQYVQQELKDQFDSDVMDMEQKLMDLERQLL